MTRADRVTAPTVLGVGRGTSPEPGGLTPGQLPRRAGFPNHV